MNSNPLTPVLEAYEVSTDCFKVAKRAVKQQQIDVPQVDRFVDNALLHFKW